MQSYVFLNGICCGQYQRMVILDWTESNLPYSPGYTESQVIEDHYYFRMVDVLGNKNSKCTPLDLSCNMKDNNDY